MDRTREISVFVDESGGFVPLCEDPVAPYYLLCMVFHDQDIDVSGEIERLEGSFLAMGLERGHCVHAGPLIRRESENAFFGGVKALRKGYLKPIEKKRLR